MGPPASPLAVFTQTPPPTPAAAPPQSPKRPLHPPPPPPVKPKPPVSKPQVPRKPHTKRVSFTTDEPEISFDARSHKHLHDDDAPELTNDACEGIGSLLIRNRKQPDLEMSRPVIKASRVLPADLIIPPPPLFDTYVSDAPFADEGESGILMPPITVVPERTLLPEPVVAETSMQSSASTDSTEPEVPLINYESFPALAQSIITLTPPSSAIISEVPSRHVFRTELPSTDEFIHELSASPSGEPDPPALLHAQYGVLPSVSHVPNSPCHLHPDETYLEDSHQPLHNSLRDLRVQNISPGMVHSKTYPPINPYPSLTTVAGHYNPYTAAVPASSQSSYHKPTLVSTAEMDINANVAQTFPNNDDTLKSVQSERRVHFGEVVMAPESEMLSNRSDGRDESHASELRPWSSGVKAFALGEVNISVRHFTIAHASFDCVRRQPNQNSTTKNKYSQSVIPSYPYPIFCFSTVLCLLTYNAVLLYFACVFTYRIIYFHISVV